MTQKLLKNLKKHSQNLIKANQPIAQQIEALVDKILTANASTGSASNPQSDTKNFEDEIDQLVYKLHNLTAEEIEIIEGGNE